MKSLRLKKNRRHDFVNPSIKFFCILRRVIAFASHPQGTSFTSSAVGRLRASGPSSDTISPRVGRLTVWDLKTMKTEVRNLFLFSILFIFIFYLIYFYFLFYLFLFSIWFIFIFYFIYFYFLFYLFLFSILFIFIFSFIYYYFLFYLFLFSILFIIIFYFIYYYFLFYLFLFSILFIFIFYFIYFYFLFYLFSILFIFIFYFIYFLFYLFLFSILFIFYFIYFYFLFYLFSILFIFIFYFIYFYFISFYSHQLQLKLNNDEFTFIHHRHRHLLFWKCFFLFFRAKLGSEVCPKVDNQTSGDTLQDLTRPLNRKSPSAIYPRVLERVLVVGCLSKPTIFHNWFIVACVYILLKLIITSL